MFQLDMITLTAITQHSARAEGKSSEKLTEATVNKLSSCNIRHWFQWKKMIVYIKKIILLLLLFIYLFILITEEPSMAKPLGLFMGTQTLECWPPYNNQHQVNSGYHQENIMFNCSPLIWVVPLTWSMELNFYWITKFNCTFLYDDGWNEGKEIITLTLAKKQTKGMVKECNKINISIKMSKSLKCWWESDQTFW